MKRALLVLAVSVLAGCDKPVAEPSAATPAPSPEEGFVGVATTQPTPAANGSPEVSSPTEDTVEVPASIDTDVSSSENELVKTQVLTRIDIMPNLSPEEKDKLYVQVERARGMGKIVTIPFPSGRTKVGPAEVASLKEVARLPQIQKYAEDPTVVFVVLGFADKKGDPKGNEALSRQRAQSVVDALKEQCGVMNLTHAVGMGSSEMFDAANLDKNRVVEVWAVLP